MDTESSRTSDDFDEDNFEDYEDEEDTLDEEESLAGRSDFEKTDELRLLNEESELSLEELRRRYLCDDVNVEDSLPDLGQANIASSSRISSSTTTTTTTACSSSVNKHSANGKTTSITNKAEKTFSNLAYLTGAPSKVEEEEGEEDEDYSPPTEGWKNVIRVGFAYQAVKLPVPGDYLPLKKSKLAPLTDEALWIPPPASSACTWTKIQEYLTECEAIRYKAEHEKTNNEFEEEGAKLNPSTSNNTNNSAKKSAVDDVFDDENALFELYCAKYNVKLAKRKAPFEWASLKSVNGPRLTYQQPWKHFTQDECAEFEHGIRTYGKNFFQISTRLMKQRRPGELIRFYYTWKKTERYDMFLRSNAEKAANVNALANANKINESVVHDENLSIHMDGSMRNELEAGANGTLITTGICTPMSGASKNQDRLTNANGLGIPKKVVD